MKTAIIAVLIAIAIAFLVSGCDNITQPEITQTDNIQSVTTIDVRILDSNGVKLYSESLPLLYVQQFREVTTNSNGDFTFNFNIPQGWGLLFESEPICFNSVDTGSVKLNFNENTFYQFAITTEPFN